jgi:hypothetical protein
VAQNGSWQLLKTDGKFLFTVKAMRKVYRAKHVALLRASELEVEKTTYDALFKREWVVYAKRPFGSPKSVVEYLGRYTHKIVINNHRILSIDDDTVTIFYKDYKAESQKKTMTLSQGEFIRRFAMHILPKRFVRIRHYGILSSTWKRSKLTNLQSKLTGISISSLPVVIKGCPMIPCPCCKSGRMITLLTFGRRGPPNEYNKAEHEKYTSPISN